MIILCAGVGCYYMHLGHQCIDRQTDRQWTWKMNGEGKLKREREREMKRKRKRHWDKRYKLTDKDIDTSGVRETLPRLNECGKRSTEELEMQGKIDSVTQSKPCAYRTLSNSAEIPSLVPLSVPLVHHRWHYAPYHWFKWGVGRGWNGGLLIPPNSTRKDHAGLYIPHYTMGRGKGSVLWLNLEESVTPRFGDDRMMTPLEVGALPVLTWHGLAWAGFTYHNII